MHFAKFVVQCLCSFLKVVCDTFGLFQFDFFIYFFATLFGILFSDKKNQSA